MGFCSKTKRKYDVILSKQQACHPIFDLVSATYSGFYIIMIAMMMITMIILMMIVIIRMVIVNVMIDNDND